MPFGVAIIDRNPTFRRGLAAVLTGHGFEVATVDPGDLVAWLVAVEPRGVVMTVEDATDMQRLRELRGSSGSAVILALTPEARGRDVGACIAMVEAGASSVLPRDVDPGTVVVALDQCRRGMVVTPTWFVADLAREVAVQASRGVTSRELEWIQRLARREATVASLAEEVNYSERHMHRILAAVYQRLDAHDRHEALEAARRRGLL